MCDSEWATSKNEKIPLCKESIFSCSVTLCHTTLWPVLVVFYEDN